MLVITNICIGCFCIFIPVYIFVLVFLNFEFKCTLKLWRMIMIFAISSQPHHATHQLAPHHPVPHHWNTMHHTVLLEYHSRSLFEAWAVRSQRQQTDRDCFELCQVPQPIYFSGTLSTLSFAKHGTPWYDKIRALLSQHHHHRWVLRAILREALGILGTKLHDGRPAPPLPHITHQTFKPHHFPPLLSNIIINQISFINFYCKNCEK